jgi:iron complex transport system substrate-binding protein
VAWLGLLVATGALLWMPPSGPAGPAGPTPAPADPGFPRQVTSADGQTLQLSSAPRRIVPTSAAAVDLVCSLVEPERIAGLPRQALDYASLAPDSPHRERALFEVYSAEPVLTLAPDLVVSDRWQAVETTARLREIGVDVLLLGDIEHLDGVRHALRELGHALGAEATCERLLASLDARVEALTRQASGRKGWSALAYSNGGTGGWVAGAGTTADEWIGLAGLGNAAARAGRQGHGRCSFEELLALDPDLIVVAGRSAWNGEGGTAELLRTEPALAGLRAVAADRIVVLEPRLYSGLGPQLVEAAEQLAASADALMAGS